LGAVTVSLSDSKLAKELGRSGTWTIAILCLLAIAVTLLFQWLGPPTVEEVESDIWHDWARATVDGQGENIAGLLARNQRDACQQLINDFGRTTARHGESFVLRTSVRSIKVINRNGATFASWQSEEASLVTGAAGWSQIEIPLTADTPEPVGSLEVLYKFNEQTFGALPNLRRLAWLHRLAGWLVAILAIAMLVAAITNLLRLRERALRVRSQQVTLDLARQLCHELRNGLWAFSLEGNNLRRLFELIDRYFAEEPSALAEAAKRLSIDSKEMDRLRRQIQKFLADRHLDPSTDVLAANELAKESQQQIESFSRYINLTVEQLDRNLLGRSLGWEPSPVRVRDCWEEACGLLALRFHSAGIQHHELIRTDDDLVMVDRRALVHIFVNLAKNALEAMRDLRPPGVITFQLDRQNDQVEAIVHNLGKPIEPTILPHIFDEGFSTKSGAGRGIGLALVKESVQRMNGTISVISDHTGTSFRLRIPSHVPEHATLPVNAST
jgi:signal transduction histidine kinase